MIDDEAKQRQYMSLLAEDANGELPSDMTADEIKLACGKAFKHMRRAMKRRFWPENAHVIEAMAAAIAHRKSKPKLVADSGVLVDRLAQWIPQQDIPTLVANANHHKRRLETSAGTEANRIIAEMIENELERRVEEREANPPDVHTASLSEIVDHWRDTNKHRSYSEMSGLELKERAVVFKRFGIRHPNAAKLTAELEKRGIEA